jgi:hypothetical protein
MYERYKPYTPRTLQYSTLQSIESNRCEKHYLASSSFIPSHQGLHYLILLLRRSKGTEAREPIRI